MIFDVIHSLINVITAGRSDIKVLLFFIYIVVLAFLFLLLKKKNFNWKISWYWPIFSLIGVYIYGLFLQIYFTISRHIPLTTSFIVINNGKMSSSVLWHTHIAKGIIGQILNFLGLNNLTNIDAGNAYVGLIPAWIFILGAILLILAIILNFAFFIFSFKNIINNVNWRRGVFMFTAYAVFSFGAIEASIDGGFFTRIFFIESIYLFLVIWSKNNNRRSIIGTFLLLFLGIFFSIFSYYIFIHRLGSSVDIASTGALFIMSSLFFYGSSQNYKKIFLIFLFFIFLCAWWMCSTRDRIVFNYANIVIPQFSEIYYYNGNKTGAVAHYYNSKTETIREISTYLNKNLTYRPIAVKGYTCDQNIYDTEITADAISDQPFPEKQLSASGYINIISGHSILLEKKYWTKLNIFINSCAPEPFSLINWELNYNGFKSLILFNLYE